MAEAARRPVWLRQKKCMRKRAKDEVTSKNTTEKVHKANTVRREIVMMRI